MDFIYKRSEFTTREKKTKERMREKSLSFSIVKNKNQKQATPTRNSLPVVVVVVECRSSVILSVRIMMTERITKLANVAKYKVHFILLQMCH